MVVRDSAGEEYLDFLGGYGVFALGHAHPRVVRAVIDACVKAGAARITVLVVGVLGVFFALWIKNIFD